MNTTAVIVILIGSVMVIIGVVWSASRKSSAATEKDHGHLYDSDSGPNAGD
jgi:hypothetical protein